MVHSDNASAPADTEGSPRPLPLVMKNEYLAHCPLILLSLSAHALILSLIITGLIEIKGYNKLYALNMKLIFQRCLSFILF